jgi:sugar-specific transcriptional regulator TrmB
MDELSTLQELGLSPNEAKLYQILVRAGRMKATELSQKSGLQRRTVYDTLSQLEKKGLTGKAEIGGVNVFSASPPASILSFLDEKRSAAEAILPLLSKPFEAEQKAQVSVLYGNGALKMVMEDIIHLKADFCVYHGQLQIVERLPKFFQIFNEKRGRLGIRARFLVLDLPDVHERAKKIPFADILFIDPASVSAGAWWTYADRVVLFIIQKELTTIFIKNKDLATAFRKNFDVSFAAATSQKNARKKPSE